MINYVETTPEMVSNVYEKSRKNITIYKEKTNQSWIIIMLYNRIKQSSKLKLKGS